MVITAYSSRNFILFSAICCFLSVITTVGIHGFFSFGPLDFNESILLYKNSLYILNRWWVIVHCLLVLISMAGIFVIRSKKTPGYLVLGMIFFTVFAITEIFRQLLVLFYLNGLRNNFLNTEDEEIRVIIKLGIENFSFINLALFCLFIFAFSLGNFFYGLSLIKEKGITQILGFLLLIWALGTSLSFLNVFFTYIWLVEILEIFSLIYQPVIRLLIAYWLWLNFKNVLDLSGV